MAKHKNWVDFRMDMETQNKRSRENLRQMHTTHKAQPSERTKGSVQKKENLAISAQTTSPEAECIHMRNEIIHCLRNAIPVDELRNTGCCVPVSLDDIRAMRSLSPEDYLVKTQVRLITEALMKCNTVKELVSEIGYLDLTGYVLNGTRFLKLNESIQSVLRRYIAPAGLENTFSPALVN